MAYIVQSTRAASLTIGGTDYTSSMIEWQASDSSVNGNGLMETTGAVILAQRPGMPDLSDYERNAFKRGESVVLNMTDINGSTFLHPRGLLYVLATSYDPESEQLSVEIGCRIALISLTDDIKEILELSPIALDDGQKNIQSIASALFAAGELVYQDNTGELVKTEFFDGDSTSGIAVGSWVSVFGQTTLSTAPLSGTSVIPDRIKVSYDEPVEEPDDTETDENGTVYTEDIEVSNYFYQYPASSWVRNPEAGDCLLFDAYGNKTEVACIEGGPDGDGGVATTPLVEEPATSDCGNTPEAPDGTYEDDSEDSFRIVPVSCNYGWETKSTPVFVSAKSTRTARTEYGGPAQQVSRVFQEVRGPKVEVNSMYFADKHAYCTYLYGYACLPGGNCPYEGTGQSLQSYAETLYFYGEDNQVTKTVRDTYATVLSAAQTHDWRSGQLGGVPQNFDSSLASDTRMYRQQRVVTEYLQRGGSQSVTLITQYDSPTSRAVGIKSGSIDAVGANGIKTTRRTTSTTYNSLPEQPDLLAAPQTETETKTTDVLVEKGAAVGGPGFTGPPEAGPYILEISLPVPVLSPDGEVRTEFIQNFVDLVPRWVKGDAYGVQVTEALRREIAFNWKPGMPFRYADTLNNTILGLRMNACSWGVSTQAAVVSIDGIWTGYSRGTLDPGSNVVGDSRPDMSGGGVIPPVNPTPVPPTIIDDVIGFNVAEVIEVHFFLDFNMQDPGADGVLPAPPTSYDERAFNIEEALTVFVAGAIVEPGTILETTGAGGMPIGSAGNLLTTGTVVVNNDLFAPGP